MTASSGSCVLLPWDSQFFGVPIGRLRPAHLTPDVVDEADAFCVREGIACLYFLAASDDVASLALAEARGFRLVDVRVTLGRAACAQDDAAPNVASDGLGAPDAPEVRPATTGELPALRRLAEVSHGDTRFFADARLASRAPALYARWIERAFEEASDGRGAVFVAALGGEPLGYLTCAVSGDDPVGNIGLVAVSSRMKRRGAGRSLVRAGLAWLARAGATRSTVVTQGRNVGAQALYQRAGFVTESVELWFHRWS